MLYWLFTEGRTWLSPFLIPLVLSALTLPLVYAAVSGAGIRRIASGSQHSVQRASLRLACIIAVSAATIAAYVTLIGPIAVTRGSGSARPYSGLLGALVGGTTRTNPQRILMFGCGLAILLLVVNGVLWQGLRSGGWLREQVDRLRRPESTRGELGSAHFCTLREFMRFRQPDPDGVMLLGAFWGDGHRRLDVGRGAFCLSGEDAARGILTIGAAGSGKSQGVILPVIADRMASGHSLIIADPQGELRPYVMDIARCTGHLLVIHDPTGTDGPRFNLAEGIMTLPAANAIAQVLIPPAQNENRFWTDSAAELLAACLIRFKSLGQVKAALDDLDALAAALASVQDDAAIAGSTFIGNLAGDGRVASNIAATLGTALSGWASAAVRANTAASDFDAALLLKQPTVVVLTCPGMLRDVYAPYLGAVLRKLMRDLDAIGESSGGPLPLPVGIILDEFPTLGRLDGLVADVNLVRKRRLSVLLAAQAKGQFHLIYGEQGTAALFTGLATQIIYGGGDHETAKFYSDASGMATVDANPDPQKTFLRQRALLTTDEIVSPADGTCHIFTRFVEPAYAAQVILKARLTRFYERDDWRRRFKAARGEPFQLGRGLERPDTGPIGTKRVPAALGNASIPFFESTKPELFAQQAESRMNAARDKSSRSIPTDT